MQRQGSGRHRWRCRATGDDVDGAATPSSSLGESGQYAVLRFFSGRGAAREEGRRHLLDLRRLSQAQVRELIG